MKAIQGKKGMNGVIWQMTALLLALAVGVTTLYVPVRAEEGEPANEQVTGTEQADESATNTNESDPSEKPLSESEIASEGDTGSEIVEPEEPEVTEVPEAPETQEDPLPQEGIADENDSTLLNDAEDGVGEHEEIVEDEASGDYDKEIDEMLWEEDEDLITFERFEQLTTPPAGYTPIYSAAEFDAIRNQPNNNYILMNDIDLSGYQSWVPIQEFSGTLDGNCYSINNMNISVVERTGELIDPVHVGLFGKTTGNVTIKRIRSVNGSIQLDAIFGRDAASNVFRFLRVGGLVGGYINGAVNISDVCCQIDIKINLTKSDSNDYIGVDTYVGGVIGYASPGGSVIERVCNYGNIEVTDNNIHSSPGPHTTFIGGIAGHFRAWWWEGGDKTSSVIRNAYNAGNVSLKGVRSSAYSTRPYIGGICGWGLKTVGGQGWTRENYEENSHRAELIIENIFNAGKVQSVNADANKGELFGAMEGWDITRPKSYERYRNCYCLSGKAGIGKIQGVEYHETYKDPTKKLTAAQMRSKSSYTGFAFQSVWEMGPDHPVLMGVASPYTYKPAKYEDGTPFPYSFRAAQDAKKGENGFGERNDTAVFRPAYFSSDSTEYKQSLALFSLQLALSAFNKTGSENEGYATAADNVTSFLENMGCEGIQLNRHSGYYGNYVYNMQPRANSIGLAAGHRPIKVNGKTYNLVVMAIRGGGYEAEWAGNFRVGTGNHHSGFYDAASEAYRFLDDYITRQGITGDVKILVSGYSRAAATANILGGAFLDNGKNRFSNGTLVPTNNIYVYTFETPKGVIKNSQLNPNAKKFDNIFNIINPDDPVPKLAPNAWGFVRYGVDCFIQTSYRMNFSGVEKQYYRVVGDPKNNREEFKEPYNIQSLYLDKMLNRIAHSFGILIPTPLSERDDYVFHFQDDIVAGCEQGNGLDGESILRALLGDEVAASRIAVLAVSFLKPSLKKKITIAKAIIGEMAFETVNLNNGADFDRLFFFHYPELCLAWMKYITEMTTDEKGDHFWSGRYKNIKLKCPVDAIIYIEGNPVAEIRDDEVISQTDGIVYADVDAFGQKSFYLMTDDEYSIVVNAYDEGKMDAVVTEYSLSDGVTEQTVFFDMTLTEGQTFNVTMHGGAVETELYRFITNGNTITPDDVISGDQLGGTLVETTVDGNGEVFGGGEYTKGDLATLYAIPDEGYDLVGWKKPVTDEWLSREEQYGFIVKEDTTLIAVFAREVAAIDLDKDYLMVENGGEQIIKATTNPEIWTQFIEKSIRTESGENVITLTETPEGDKITATGIGTAYVEYRLKTPKKELLAECRVDVYDETEELEDQLDGVRLKNTSATSNIYSTTYIKIQLLPLLQQNQMAPLYGNGTGRFPEGVDDAAVALDYAEFADSRTAEMFSLRIADDNTLEIVPTPYALENVKSVKSKYQSKVQVRVGTKTYETAETLSLMVKKNLPALKTKALSINSFYDRTDYELTITGGEVLSLSENVARPGNVPEWLTFTPSGTGVKLAASAPVKWSGTVYLTAKLKGWAIDIPVTQKITITRTDPALKLSVSSVTIQDDYANSKGIPIILSSKNKKLTLTSANVQDVVSITSGYKVEEFNLSNGRFVLKAERTPVNKEKVVLNVLIDEAKPVPFTITVYVKKTVQIKASRTSLALNPSIAVDKAEIKLSSNPADYLLSDHTLNITVTDTKNNPLVENEWLDIKLDGDILRIKPVYRTLEKDTTVRIKLRGSHNADKDTVVSVKLYGGKNTVPTVALSAKGAIDLSVPASGVTITPSFKNYSGLANLVESYRVTAIKKKVSLGDATDSFLISKNANGTFTITAVPDAAIDPAATYSVLIQYSYNESGSGVGESWFMLSNARQFTVKKSKVNLRFSKSSLSLNPNVYNGTVYDNAVVNATPTVKNAMIEDVTYTVTKGKNIPANDELNVRYDSGTVIVSANAKTVPNTSYAVAFGIKGNPAAGKITVKTLKDTVKPAVSVSQKGTLDVIRPSSAITLTPKIANLYNPAIGDVSFTFTATNNNKEVNTAEIAKKFVVKQQDGKYLVSASDNAFLYTTKAWKYYVTVNLKIGETTVSSKPLLLNIKMGSAKVTPDKKTVTLYAQDRYSDEVIQLSVPDKNLSEIDEISVAGTNVPFDVTDLGGGYIAVGFKGNNVVTKGQTIKLNIYFKGNTAREKANVVLSVTVNVKK